MRDHPMIERALATGYPNPPEKHVCRECGYPASAYRDDKGFMCFDCARHVFEDLSDEEAVELLDFEVLE